MFLQNLRSVNDDFLLDISISAPASVACFLHAFSRGLEGFEEYVKALQGGKAMYDGTKIRKLVDDFAPVLAEHLKAVGTMYWKPFIPTQRDSTTGLVMIKWLRARRTPSFLHPKAPVCVERAPGRVSYYDGSISTV